MSRIGYCYGSERHLLRWLGYQGADQVDWLDLESAPPGAGPFETDREWVNLDFLPAEHPARAAWRSVWPRAWGRIGPHWDAVGVASIDGRQEWVLVEAKANVAEVQSRLGPRVAEASRARIAAALANAAPDFDAAANDAWLRGGYQIANRLCALQTLIRNGAPAHLVLLYLCGDDAGRYRRGNAAASGVACPDSEAEWRELVLDDLHSRLGWEPASGPLGSRVHEMFIPLAPSDRP